MAIKAGQILTASHPRSAPRWRHCGLFVLFSGIGKPAWIARDGGDTSHVNFVSTWFGTFDDYITIES